MKLLNKSFFFLNIAIFFSYIFIACAVTHPEREFIVRAWKPIPAEASFKHKDKESGEILVMLMENLTHGEYMLLSIEDYILEREYQELLIKSCKTWR